MADIPHETLDQFRARVKNLEAPRPTSTLLARFGWPVFGIGIVMWAIQIIMPGNQFLLSIFALLLLAIGVMLLAVSFFSAYSENLERSERKKRIRERAKVQRCLYLEGNIPDGSGSVGRCTLYNFDMVDYPYCIYCREYTPSKGSPSV